MMKGKRGPQDIVCQIDMGLRGMEKLGTSTKAEVIPLFFQILSESFCTRWKPYARWDALCMKKEIEKRFQSCAAEMSHWFTSLSDEGVFPSNEGWEPPK